MDDVLEFNQNADQGSQENATEPIYEFAMTADSERAEVVSTENVVADLAEAVTVETPIVDTEEVTEEYESVELTEDLALQHLASLKGVSVEEFKESLTAKQQKEYAPEIVAFNDYYEKTGDKNYNNFLETQKDWTAETSETVLREYIKLSNPDLSKKEQDFLYNDKYSIEDLDEDDDENLITKKGIELKKDLRNANDFFAKRKEEFIVGSGTDAYIPAEYRDYKKQIENQTKEEQDYNTSHEIVRNDFLAKTNAHLNDNFEGFKFKLGNEADGYSEVAFKPENVKEAREFVSDYNNLMKEFQDKEGNLVKGDEYRKALYLAKYGEKLINQAYNRGKADKVEADDRLSKNIQIDNASSTQQPILTGYTFSIDN